MINEPVVNNKTATFTKPIPCTYIVRFWMDGVGYARQEMDASDAILAGEHVRKQVIMDHPDASVIVIGIVRK